MDESERYSPLRREPLEHARAYYRFVFPYEIQIVDAETHRNNVGGLASHDTYKRRQVEAARTRVLGSLVRKRPLDKPGKGKKQPKDVEVKEPVSQAERPKIFQWLLEESEPVQ